MARIIQYIHRPNMTELGMGNTHDRYLVGPEETLKQFFPLEISIDVFDVLSEKTYKLYSKYENNEFRIKLMGDICDDYQLEPGDEIIFTRYESKNDVKTTLQVVECGRVFLNPGKRENGIIKDFEIVNIEKIPHFIKGTNYSCDYTFKGKKHKIEISFLETRKKRTDSPLSTDFYSVKYDGKELENKNNPIYYLTIKKGKVILKNLPKYEYKVLWDDDGDKICVSDKTLQQIFYGAPGTGKSNKIEEETKGKSVIRTTFHPDSDYSTFVGCYKPTMEEVATKVVPVVVKSGISLDDPGVYKEKRVTYKFVKQAFLKAYLLAWKKYSDVKGTKSVGSASATTLEQTNPNITPETKPEKEELHVDPVYLVIEEINRGNCAQIFGDIFQLLDRKGGFSEYPIEADDDLRKAVAEAFKYNDEYRLTKNINVDWLINDYTSNREGSTLSKDIQDGYILLLPENLYIWATMNTSDQSLFPIDSAFKRRWDWQYIKITEGKDKNDKTKSLEWKILVPYTEKLRTITEGELESEYRLYDWWSFVQKINKVIFGATQSADKQLGYFFAKATEEFNGTKIGERKFDREKTDPEEIIPHATYYHHKAITAKTFVNKVLFYLWTDVMKDNDDNELTDLMKKDKKDITFPDFFKETGDDIDNENVCAFLDNVMLKKIDEIETVACDLAIKEDVPPSDNRDEDDDDEDDDKVAEGSKKLTVEYKGDTSYTQSTNCKTYKGILAKLVEDYPNLDYYKLDKKNNILLKDEPGGSDSRKCTVTIGKNKYWISANRNDVRKKERLDKVKQNLIDAAVIKPEDLIIDLV